MGQEKDHFILGAAGEKLGMALVCEQTQCKRKVGEDTTRFDSHVYEIPSKIGVHAKCLLDLSSKVNLERFYASLEVSGIIKQGEQAIEELLRLHPSAAAILGLKISVVLGKSAAPVYLVGVLLVQHAIATCLDKLRRDCDDAAATQIVRDRLFSTQYGIGDIGGPGHAALGEWMKRTDVEGKRALYGGLTRWLDPVTNQFAWLCPEDAYERIETYRTTLKTPTNPTP